MIMLSNQVLQKVIQDIKKISGLECGIWDVAGICLAMTDQRVRELDADMQAFLTESALTQVKTAPDRAFFIVTEEEKPAYVLALSGVSPHQEAVGYMGVSQLTNLLTAYQEKMDKNRFFQHLLTVNMPAVDAYNQAKKLRIPVEQKRVVFAIEAKQEGKDLVLETLKGLFATGTGDFVTAIDEKRVILIKALEAEQAYPEIERIARMTVDTLNAEAMVSVRVAYGQIITEINDLPRSYQEAMAALEVGRVFYGDRNILAYRELGIGRLIQQLSASLCEMFLQEVFRGTAVEAFDEEELTTVYTFFNNNLNISETARQLFVHRNTLVYRLEKIEKKTGLDVRVFEDAVTFKIAMMVADHLRAMEQAKIKMGENAVG